MSIQQRATGFVLPVIIMLGVATSMMTILLSSMVISSSFQLNNQALNGIASEAAQAGVAMAISCIRTNPSVTWTQLTPDMNCTGAAKSADAPSYSAIAPDGAWQARYVVRAAKDASTYGANVKQYSVVGIAQRYQGANPVGSLVTTTRIFTTKPSTGSLPNALGEVATDLRADNSLCSINNGQLYCWGQGTSGQMGNNTITLAQKTPLNISAVPGSPLNGKFISKLTVSDTAVCVIADGTPYCWGGNLAGQVGNGSLALAVTKPAAVKGSISGRFATDISTSSSNTPLPQFIPTAQHSCAITDGAPMCWGGNDYQQTGMLNCSNLSDQIGLFSILAPIVLVMGGQARYCSNMSFFGLGGSGGQLTSLITTQSAPVYGYENWDSGPFLSFLSQAWHNIVGVFDPVFGAVGVPGPGNSSWFGGVPSGNSNQSKLYGMKMDRVGAGSHYSCGITQGKLYCWGIAIPFNWGTPLFTLTTQPFNYTGYSPDAGTWHDMLNGVGLGSMFDQMFPTGVGWSFADGLDAKGFSMGGDFVCVPSSRNIGCMGFTPAYSGALSIVTAYIMNAPFNLLPNSDVTASDDGAWSVPVLGGFVGTYCLIDGGVPKCMGSLSSSATGTGKATLFLGDLQPLLTTGTNGQNGLTDANGTNKSATAIGAAGLYGAVVANGQVFTWGAQTSGELGNGGAPTTVNAPTQIGMTAANYGGSSPVYFGTKQGTYAWTSTATAGGHSCGVQNGHVACWGKNDKGQLGIGTSDSSKHESPAVLPSVSDKIFSKVSVGTNHSCGISKGYLYCWGDNTYGQLGIGNVLNSDYGTGKFVTAPRMVSIPTSARVTDVSAGDKDTCAIVDGRTWCWGDNTYGQLGNNTVTTSGIPVQVGGSLATSTPTSISVGTTHVCAVAGGDGYCWGTDSYGELGDGTSGGVSKLPGKITTGTAAAVSPEALTGTFTGITAGKNFSCGIINSIVSCWGRNDKGQLGIGTESWQEQQGTYWTSCLWLPFNPNNCTNNGSVLFPNWQKQVPNMVTVTGTRDKSVPTRLTGDPSNRQALNISAGDDSACATVNGKLYCWGSQATGKLGNGSSASASISTPVQLGGSATGNAATTISAGGINGCAVANGKMICWGDNQYGQIGLAGAIGPVVTPTSASDTLVLNPVQITSMVF